MLAVAAQRFRRSGAVFQLGTPQPLGIECVKEVIEPLEEPDAVSRHLGRIECAGSCVLQGIAPRRRITNPTSGFFRPNGILRLEIEETRRTVLPRVIS